MNHKKHSCLQYLIAYVLALVPRLIVAGNMIPLRTLSDETATVVSAARLAGNDWSNVVSQAGYYGFGFYWIFWWIFKLFDDPILIYRLILIMISLMQSIIAVIAMYLARHYFRIKSIKVSILLAVCSSFFVVTRISILYNEHVLVIISWILAFIMLKLQEIDECSKENKKNKKKLMYTIFLIMLQVYVLTIHTRAIVYTFAVVIVIVGYKIVQKKSLVSRGYFLFLLCGVYVCRLFVAYVQKNIWMKEAGQALRNSKVSINGKYNFLDINTWKTLFNGWIGQINTINIFTCSLFLVSIIFLGVIVCRCVKEKNTGIEKSNDEKCFLLVGIFFLLCIMGTIFIQPFSWFDGVYNALTEGATENIYSYKLFTYVRYFGIYLGPFLLCGMIYCYKNIDILKKKMLLIILIYFMFEVYWFQMILPYIKTNEHTREVFMAFSFWRNEQKTNINMYLIGFVVLNLFIFGLCLCIKQRHIEILFFLICIVMIYQYIYTAFYQDCEVAKKNYEKIDASYEYLANSKKEIEELKIEDIYYYDVYPRDHSNYYNLQFYMNSFKVIVFEEYTGNELIIVSNAEIEEKIPEDNYLKICLDTQEYVYIRNDIFTKMEQKSIGR